MARLSRFAVAAGTSTAIILLLTLGVSTLGLWPGENLFVRDIILHSSIILPFILGLIASVWPSRSLNRSRWVACTIGAGTGLIYGYFAQRVFWAVVVGHAHWSWHSLGQVDWEMDLEGAVCTVVAGTCALLLSVTRRTRPVITTVVVLTLAGMIVPAPAFNLINHNQELTIAVVTPRSAGPSDEAEVSLECRSTPVETTSSTRQVMDLIYRNGITGKYRVSNLCRTGRGKKALEVIVLNQRVVSEVQLPEPRGGDIIYVQLPDRWKKIPSQLPTLSRSVIVGPAPTEDSFASMEVYTAGEWSSGFVVWTTSQQPAQEVNPLKAR